MERSKYLRPTFAPFTQHELVLKLAHHFHRDIRLAIYTQGIKTVEDLLILLTQSEHMFHTDYRNKTNFQDERRFGVPANLHFKSFIFVNDLVLHRF